jgi:TolA-binding protein
MKKNIINGIALLLLAIVANYPMYKDLQHSVKVAQGALKSMDTIVQTVQAEIISWQESVNVLQERIDVIQFELTETINSGLAQTENALNKIKALEVETIALNNKIDNLKTQAKDKVNKTIKSKKEELKNKIPGLDKLKF